MILDINTKKHHREIPVFSAVCVILAVTVAIAAIFIFMFSNQNRIIESNKEFLRESSEQLTSRINVRLNNSIDKIVILSQSMGLHLNSTEFDDSFKEHLKNIRNIVEGSLFDYIEFADVNGINHNVTGGTSKANDREYFIEAMKGKSGFSYVCDSRATHETLISFMLLYTVILRWQAHLLVFLKLNLVCRAVLNTVSSMFLQTHIWLTLRG